MYVYTWYVHVCTIKVQYILHTVQYIYHLGGSEMCSGTCVHIIVNLI